MKGYKLTIKTGKIVDILLPRKHGKKRWKRVKVMSIKNALVSKDSNKAEINFWGEAVDEKEISSRNPA